MSDFSAGLSAGDDLYGGAVESTLPTPEAPGLFSSMSSPDWGNDLVAKTVALGAKGIGGAIKGVANIAADTLTPIDPTGKELDPLASVGITGGKDMADWLVKHGSDASDYLTGFSDDFAKKYEPDQSHLDFATKLVDDTVGGIAQFVAGEHVAPYGGNIGFGQSASDDKVKALIAEGVDPEEARQLGVLAGGFAVATTAIPGAASTKIAPAFAKPILESLPGRIGYRTVVGAGAQTAFGLASRGASAAALEAAGYHDQAKQEQWNNAASMASDAILGAAFGNLAHESHGAAPDGVSRETPPNTGPDEPPPPSGPSGDQIRAAMVVKDAQHRNVETAPGIPTGPAGDALHAENLRRTQDAFANDESPSDLLPYTVSDEHADTGASPDFIPHPVDHEAIARVHEALNDSSFSDEDRAALLEALPLEDTEALARSMNFPADENGDLMYSRGRPRDQGQETAVIESLATDENRQQRAARLGYSSDASYSAILTRIRRTANDLMEAGHDEQYVANYFNTTRAHIKRMMETTQHQRGVALEAARQAKRRETGDLPKGRITERDYMLGVADGLNDTDNAISLLHSDYPGWLKKDEDEQQRLIDAKVNVLSQGLSRARRAIREMGWKGEGGQSEKAIAAHWGVTPDVIEAVMTKRSNGRPTGITDHVTRLSQRQSDGSLLTSKQIAGRLNTMGYHDATPASVRVQQTHLRNAGIDIPYIRESASAGGGRPKASHDQVWALLDQGMSQSAVARAVHLTPGRVNQIVKAGRPENVPEPKRDLASTIYDLSSPQAREEWGKQNFYSEPIPGEADTSRQYSFKTPDGEIVTVGIAPEAGTGATTIDWTFLGRLKQDKARLYAKEDGTPLRERENIGALTVRVVSAVEADIKQFHRDAYVFTPASRSHTFLYARMLRQFRQDGYHVLERDGDFYLLRDGAELARDGHVIPLDDSVEHAPKWEPISDEDAATQQERYYEAVQSFEPGSAEPGRMGVREGTDGEGLAGNEGKTGGEEKFSAGSVGGRSTPDELKTALTDYFGAKDINALLDAGRLTITDTANLPFGERASKQAGIYNPRDGKAYLNADNVSAKDAAGIILHEIGVHHGMRDMLGTANWERLLNQVETLVKTHKAGRDARAMAEEFSNKPEHVPEETLAYLVENAPDLPIVQRVLAHVRQFLWRTFGDTFGKNLSVDDIRAMAVASLRRAATQAGRDAAGEGDMMSSMARRAPAFYSALSKSVSDSKTGKASAQQWKATLAKTPGLKKEELEWTGVNDWLDAQESQAARGRMDIPVQYPGRDAYSIPVEINPSSDGLARLRVEGLKELRAAGDVRADFAMRYVRDAEGNIYVGSGYDAEHDAMFTGLRKIGVDFGDRAFGGTSGSLRFKDGKWEDKKGTGLSDNQWTPFTPAKPKSALVSREALQQFVDQNGVRVQEVLKGEPSNTDDIQRKLLPLIEERDRLERELFSLREDGGDGIEFHKREKRLQELQGEIFPLAAAVTRAKNDRGDQTKWSQYTLPGAEAGSYRELLLTLPVEKPVADKIKSEEEWRAAQHAEERRLTELTSAWYRALPEAERDPRGPSREDSPYAAEWSALRERAPLSRVQNRDAENQTFRSSHFDEPNILAHVRFDSRTDAAGRKTLFLNEVQSDWLQAIRERGHKEPPASPAEKGQINSRLEEIMAEQNKLYDAASKEAGFDSFDAVNANRDHRGMAGSIASHVENGAEYKALQDEFDRLATRRDGFDTRPPNAPFKNNAWVALVLKRIIRYAAENGHDQIAWTPGEVQNDRYPGRPEKEQAGMRKFYNEILPNIANDIGKKYGAKVGETEIGTGKTIDIENAGRSWIAKVYFGYFGDKGVLAQEFKTPEEARAWAEAQKEKTHVVHTLPLSDSLRSQALDEGFPLFSKGAAKRKPEETAARAAERDGFADGAHAFGSDADLNDLAAKADAGASAKELAAHPVIQGVAKEAASQVPTMKPESARDASFWRKRRYVVNGKRVPLAKALDHLEKRADSAGKPAKFDKQALVVIGPQGAGKSSFIKAWAKAMGAAVPDADMAKEVIPEYRGGQGTIAAHAEGLELRDQVTRRIVEQGRNIIVERVGFNPDNEAKMRELIAQGYDVRLAHIDVHGDEAARRATKRFLATGRYPMNFADYDKAHTLRDIFNKLIETDAVKGHIQVDANGPEPRLTAADKSADLADALGERLGRVDPTRSSDNPSDARSDGAAESGERNADPVKQTLADDPGLEIATDEGSVSGEKALADAEAEEAGAKQMAKGFKAAASCAIQHGLGPGIRVSSDIAAAAFARRMAGYAVGAAAGGVIANTIQTSDTSKRWDREAARHAIDRPQEDHPIVHPVDAEINAEQPALPELQAPSDSDGGFAPGETDAMVAPADAPGPGTFGLPSPVNDGSQFAAKVAASRETKDGMGGVGGPGLSDKEWRSQMNAHLDRNRPWAKPGDYETNLSAKDEHKFRDWVKTNKVPFNPNDDISDYDMRGFWQASQRHDPSAETGIDPNDGKMHFSDKWKTPYHETFSNQSMYAKPNAPHWAGDKLIDERGHVLFDDAARGGK